MPINPQTALFAQIQQQNRYGPQRAFGQLGQGIEKGVGAISEALRRVAEHARRQKEIAAGREFQVSEREAGQEFSAQQNQLDRADAFMRMLQSAQIADAREQRGREFQRDLYERGADERKGVRGTIAAHRSEDLAREDRHRAEDFNRRRFERAEDAMRNFSRLAERKRQFDAEMELRRLQLAGRNAPETPDSLLKQMAALDRMIDLTDRIGDTDQVNFYVRQRDQLRRRYDAMTTGDAPSAKQGAESEPSAEEPPKAPEAPKAPGSNASLGDRTQYKRDVAKYREEKEAYERRVSALDEKARGDAIEEMGGMFEAAAQRVLGGPSAMAGPFDTRQSRAAGRIRSATTILAGAIAQNGVSAIFETNEPPERLGPFRAGAGDPRHRSNAPTTRAGKQLNTIVQDWFEGKRNPRVLIANSRVATRRAGPGQPNFDRQNLPGDQLPEDVLRVFIQYLQDEYGDR